MGVIDESREKAAQDAANRIRLGLPLRPWWFVLARLMLICITVITVVWLVTR